MSEKVDEPTFLITVQVGHQAVTKLTQMVCQLRQGFIFHPLGPVATLDDKRDDGVPADILIQQFQKLNNSFNSR